MLSLIWLSTLDSPAGMGCWESQEQNSKGSFAGLDYSLSQVQNTSSRVWLLPGLWMKDADPIPFPPQHNPTDGYSAPIVSWDPKAETLLERMLVPLGARVWALSVPHVSDTSLQVWPYPTVRNTYYTATQTYVLKIFMKQCSCSSEVFWYFPILFHSFFENETMKKSEPIDITSENAKWRSLFGKQLGSSLKS